eukprot:CAMPEP_0177613600 /NCGR_PEP_ID=MMETSP0419_2-20121207/22094_1 /TAXON_ID=582737 /ORGANISM="Tetraselmis sp., Strain GSL018" /LENGTH=120 /DNA_ID=CAMNT_0019110373 /DNA_START=975 /DNA_END=1334 /DNA_ORIENTATION=-
MPASRENVQKPLEPVIGSCAWYSKEYARPESYTYYLSDVDIGELDEAVKKVQDRNLDIKAKARGHEAGGALRARFPIHQRLPGSPLQPVADGGRVLGHGHILGPRPPEQQEGAPCRPHQG